MAATEPTRPVTGVPDPVSWLLDRATYRQTRGEPSAALPLFRRAYAARRDRLGDDPDTLSSAGNLAADLRALGEDPDQ